MRRADIASSGIIFALGLVTIFVIIQNLLLEAPSAAIYRRPVCHMSLQPS
jgi:hypothetical protein